MAKSKWARHQWVSKVECRDYGPPLWLMTVGRTTDWQPPPKQVIVGHVCLAAHNTKHDRTLWSFQLGCSASIHPNLVKNEVGLVGVGYLGRCWPH